MALGVPRRLALLREMRVLDCVLKTIDLIVFSILRAMLGEL